MKYLVDSDYVADYLKGRDQATSFLDHLFPDGIAISIVTFAEVYEGIFYGHQPDFYKTALRQFLQGVRVLPLTRAIAIKYAVLRGELHKQGKIIDQPDLFIAATAITYKLTLVTRNIKDYQRIPQLSLYHLENLKSA